MPKIMAEIKNMKDKFPGGVVRLDQNIDEIKKLFEMASKTPDDFEYDSSDEDAEVTIKLSDMKYRDTYKLRVRAKGYVPNDM